MRLAIAIVLALANIAEASECESIPVWRDGRHDGSVCVDDVVARGMVAIDLRDDWVPLPIALASYRATYVELANERFQKHELAARDRYLELFGVLPTPSVVANRLGDEARHRCHAEIDDAPLAKPLRLVEKTLATRERDRRRVAAIRAVQAHLACDALLVDRPVAGAYTWQTSNAVQAFQRGAMIVPTGTFDEPTRAAFLQGSRERDLRAALRVLRERVIAGTGLVEDGTAGAGMSTVLGRMLEPEATWRVRGHEPLAAAAPDLISPATEAVARALGWSDAESIRAFLSTQPRLVAVPAPGRPDYHATMALAVEIDRGDVWRERKRTAARRPALILYAVTERGRIPLVRWPTTIGGWQPEKLDGAIARRWKESPVGRRIWRDLYVGPSWLPPPSTPDRELVRSVGGRYVLARELLGPSYRSAYGLVAFIHLVDDRDRPWDQGIRTHGTANLASLANGVSHGCHRLLGLHAVRLAAFVLAHHGHVVHGELRTHYRRVVRVRPGRFPIAIDTLGTGIELVPPIPIEVLPGRVHR